MLVKNLATIMTEKTRMKYITVDRYKRLNEELQKKGISKVILAKKIGLSAAALSWRFSGRTEHKLYRRSYKA